MAASGLILGRRGVELKHGIGFSDRSGRAAGRGELITYEGEGI
jgi:hypothetical protein